MTDSPLDLIVALLQLAAAALFAVSAIGVWRLPDLAARIHSPTKAASLGIALFAAALALHHGDPRWLIEIAVLVLFVFVTVPLSSQVLLRAVRPSSHDGASPKNEKTARPRARRS